MEAKKKKAPAKKKQPAQGAAHTPRNSDETQLALVRAAEKLMAERGIDAVSLREVSVEAGQANNSAVAYHFGSRDALIDAILARHSHPIHARWDAQLDMLERQGNKELRPLIEMLVLEIVSKLDDPDGGPEFISISGQLSVAPRMPLVERDVRQTPTVLRFVNATMPFSLQAPSLIPLLPIHYERLATTIYTSTIAWHRTALLGANTVSRKVFESDLIDVLVALIMQKPSAQTTALIEADAKAAKAKSK